MKASVAAALLALAPSWALADEESPFRDAQKSYWIPALEIIAFDAALNQYDRHYFGCCEFHSNMRTIRRNLRSSWVVDRDPFLVNQLGHPYQGSMYHAFARSAGLNYWEGLGYTFLASAMWEIAGETTPPSRNDQVNTGIGGSFLGEALFRMASLTLEHPGDMKPWQREILATAISPPVGFNRYVFDRFRLIYPGRDPLYFIRAQAGFSGATDNHSGTSTTRLRAKEALVDFLIDYGLPGKPEYKYTRPFDYFSFQATASSANGFENAFTRGLLIGRDYDVGSRYHGVWGLYGNYDYIAPQIYRVSATGLSLGTTAQWWIDDRWRLVGTVTGGIGYTAAGATGGSNPNPSLDNDYHYGLAPQALGVMRLVYKNKAALDLAAREYYVTRAAAADRGGHVNVARLEAAFTYRVSGHHAVSLRYLFNRRDAAFPDVGDRSQRRATLGLFYSYLGRHEFGTQDPQ
ncbi:MAG TPA: DUF3943 domain-containing protein [Usitatibacter sp.]|nr:DUF3943 domain-containing protein [Usitatibacter sp.]